MITIKRLIVAAAVPLLVVSVACGGGARARSESEEWRGRTTPTFAAFVDQGTLTPAPPAADWAALGIDGARTPSPSLDVPRTEATTTPPPVATATPGTTNRRAAPESPPTP